MTPEAAGYLAKARDLLAQAEAMQGIELWDSAGRRCLSRGRRRNLLGHDVSLLESPI